MIIELFRMDATGTVWQEPTLFDSEPAPTLLDQIQATPPAAVRPMLARITTPDGRDFLRCQACHGTADIGDPTRTIVLPRIAHDCGAGSWVLPDAPAWRER